MERYSKYIPHHPTDKQQEFLDLDCDEALYGGAAGGGKSDVLLSWILEGAETPGYRGLLLRRTFPELESTFISRSQDWLAGTDAVYNDSKHQWKFPSGAVVQFGHIQNEKDKYKYQGREYHRIAFDELTHFTKTQYTYLMSRLRRVIGFPIKPAVRAGTNPGGEGHFWVKERFLTQQILEEVLESTRGVYYHEGRAFVPSRIADNPYIDEDEYMAKLSNLSPVERVRLAKGDWSVIEDALINSQWFRRYTMRGLILKPRKADNSMFGEGIDERQCRRFAVLDSAGTEEDKEREKQGKPPSYSALGVWDYAADYDKALFLRHIWRGRVGFTDLISNICRVLDDWDTTDIYIENAHFGKAIADVIRKRRGVRVKVHFVQPTMGLGRTGKPGKVERSTTLQNKMEQGQYYLPDSNVDWLLPYEGELLSWTGKKDDIADQVDISSYAAMICEKGSKMRAAAPWTGGNGFSLLG